MKSLTILLLALFIGFVPCHNGMNLPPVTVSYPTVSQIDILQEYTNYIVSLEGSIHHWRNIKANIHDRGGETNYGLTYPTYQSLCPIVLCREPDYQHFCSLTSKDIKPFILWHYNLMSTCDMHPAIAILLTETAWGCGVQGAKDKLMLTLIHKFGYHPKSYEDAVNYCINVVPINEFVPAFLLERKQNLLWVCQNDSTQNVFRNGWIRRIDSLECFIHDNIPLNDHSDNY
jgi:hypothetical protein